MREIKYQLWTGKEIVEVYSIEFLENNEYVVNEEYPVNFQSPDCAKSTPYILREFTGLKDKLGKEIYDGDIVKHLHFGNKIVCWNEWKGAWYLSPTIDKNSIDKDYFIDKQDDNFCEVIGNIFQNKELLDDNKKTETT